MRAQAPATIKCLLKGLREAGTSAPSFPPRKTLPVGRSRSCKGKQRQESWVVTSWAKGQQAGTKEVVSAQAQKSMHTGIEAASATSVEQEEKKTPAATSKTPANVGSPVLSPCWIHLHSPPASLTGLALPTLPSLLPAWQTHCSPGILVTRHARLEDVLSSRVPFSPRATSLLFSSSLST